MMAGNDNPLIRFEHVAKAFGSRPVHRDITFDIRRGETICLLGGSGTGKSVLLKLLLGFLETDSGHIYFDGTDVTTLSEDDLLPVRRRVSMLFQGAALFDSLSVYDNIAFPLREQELCSEAEIKDKVAEKLEMVGLPGVEDLFPANLSGGMKKRVGLARAIATDPEVILYDEPSTGLDPTNTRRINELIRKLQQRIKVTSVVVTHDMTTVFEVADRIAMIRRGEVAAVGTQQEIRNHENPFVRGFIDGTLPLSET